MKIKFLCPVIRLRRLIMAYTPTLTAMYKRNEAYRMTNVTKEGHRFTPLYKRFHGQTLTSNDKEPA